MHLVLVGKLDRDHYGELKMQPDIMVSNMT